MLTNFLLTRIEHYPGIVVLTSNSRNRIDTSFIRRLDVILEFPLPGVEERLRIWHSHLGRRSPSGEDCRLLAGYCDLPGGHIRNAVLNAAARSARPSTEPLEMALLLAALREEYGKLGRAVPPAIQQIKG
jgi:SpoVK/Ycf46/Vps4 family AAA+-type ATPase